MVSKILHFHIFCFFCGQYKFLNFFKNFEDCSQIIKVCRYFQQKLIFGQKSNFDTNYIQKPTQAHKFSSKILIYQGNTSQKMKKIYVHMLASDFSHTRKKKNSQNRPYFDCNYLEKPTSAHRSFCFFLTLYHLNYANKS